MPETLTELLGEYAALEAGPKASDNVRNKIAIGKLHRMRTEGMGSEDAMKAVLRAEIAIMKGD